MIVKSCDEGKDLRWVVGSKEKWSVVMIKGLKIASLAGRGSACGLHRWH
jgi:hypothetical protein